MYFLKGLLWIWLVIDSIPHKDDTEQDKIRRSINMGIYLLCLTLIYTFGGK